MLVFFFFVFFLVTGPLYAVYKYFATTCQIIRHYLPKA